jgi:hypothetical protein
MSGSKTTKSMLILFRQFLFRKWFVYEAGNSLPSGLKVENTCNS